MKVKDYFPDIRNDFLNPIKIDHNSKIEFLNSIHWDENDEVLIKNKDGQIFEPSEMVVHYVSGKKIFYICE